MNLQVTQENLHKALTVVSRVADSRGSLPVLANILLRTDGSRLQITATNLEIAITKRIGSKVVTPGEITVPARLMNDFVASLPGGTITLKLDQHKLKVSSGNYQSTINGLSTEEFPEIPQINDADNLTMKTQDLKKALSQTVFAASNDDSRPVLTGVLFAPIDGALTVVATDSYRLAEKSLGTTKLKESLLLPASAAQEMLRILPDAPEETTLLTNETQVYMKAGDTELTSRLIDGAFPQYRQLLPETADISFTISRDEFINITKVASLFARESAGSITLEVDEADQSISINSVASQVGENNSKAHAKVEGGGKVTLNSRFLLEGLGAFSCEEVTFSFSGTLSPCVITGDKADSDYRHVVMPLKA
jgi:DNA polymerase-3 subunit beta